MKSRQLARHSTRSSTFSPRRPYASAPISGSRAVVPAGAPPICTSRCLRASLVQSRHHTKALECSHASQRAPQPAHMMSVCAGRTGALLRRAHVITSRSIHAHAASRHPAHHSCFCLRAGLAQTGAPLNQLIFCRSAPALRGRALKPLTCSCASRCVFKACIKSPPRQPFVGAPLSEAAFMQSRQPEQY